jgi:hypothetical protein
VGNELQDVYPEDVYSSTVAAHAVVKLSRSMLVLGDTFSPGALVNVIVTSPKKADFVTVYPDGTSRPSLSTVQFQAGRAAENTTLATGVTDFYNGSAGPIHLDIVTYGIEDITSTQGAGSDGETYQPVTPTRVLPRSPADEDAREVAALAGVRGGLVYQRSGYELLPVEAEISTRRRAR